MVLSAFYHIAPCLWCSMREKSSSSALGDAATSVETGRWCQPSLSTGFDWRQTAHSNTMRRKPSVTGPAQPRAAVRTGHGGLQDMGSGQGGAGELAPHCSATGQPRRSTSFSFCGTECQQELEAMTTGQARSPFHVAALICQ